MHDQDEINTVGRKIKYYWKNDTCIIKIKVDGHNDTIFHNMLPYKLDYVHVKEYTLEKFRIRHNNNVYHGVYR